VAGFRENIAKAFAARDVAPERVVHVPVRGAHMAHYNAIDIALDSFPQTGGTTTCETLYMGVPVVSLVGDAFFERLSYSNLSNAGLGELATYSRQAYVESAVALASAQVWRADFRRTARARLAAHPLGDPVRFTRDFEAAACAWMDEGKS
jgi:predicted O-linked N-acetylglucosamine transferase (SPINDLY family)